MEIKTKMDGSAAELVFTGRLDTTTSPQLESALVDVLAAANNITFDFAKLDYLSSAGLRVILSTHKKLKAAGGQLTVKNVNEVVMNVFNLTGFSDILNIA